MIHNILIEISGCFFGCGTRRNISMATCERCGNEIPEQVTICPSCGTPVSTTQLGSQAETQQPYDPQKEWNTHFPASACEEYTPQPRPIYELNNAPQSNVKANDPPQQA